MDLFVLAAVGISAVMAGFWIGRWSGQAIPVGAEGNPEMGRGRQEADASSDIPADGEYTADRQDTRGGRQESAGIRINRYHEHEKEKPHKRRVMGKKHSVREKKIPLGWAIGSPVSGMVSTFYEGSRRGALLLPDQGRVYAPASGKIIRLYPMGNRILLRADSGVELLIQVGGEPDELCGIYFRPRVVQNEIVSKGKLLLEYDRERLAAEGADTKVSISVEEADNLRDITVTGMESVKAGEELLWVREYEYLT